MSCGRTIKARAEEVEERTDASDGHEAPHGECDQGDHQDEGGCQDQEAGLQCSHVDVMGVMGVIVFGWLVW